MRYLFVIVLLLLILPSYGQLFKNRSQEENVQKAVEGDAEWSEGSIMLTDGTEAKGQLKYNDRTGVVSFESGKTSGSYNARNLMGFEFYDNRGGYQRYFFSLPYESAQDGRNINQIFEVIRQYKNLAVIIKSDPIDIRRRRTYTPIYSTPTTQTDVVAYRTIVDQITTLFFLDSNMKIMPFLEITDRDLTKTDKWAFFDGDKVKVKILDKDLPRDLMGEHYEKVRIFARERNLEWDVKDNLVSILDYYDSLVEN